MRQVAKAAKADKASPESPREMAMSTATSLITNLLRCVLWLLRHGIYVVGFSGRRRDNGTDVVTVRVAASPYLYRLMTDANWFKQHRDGNLVTHTWQSIRFGTVIEWEEVTCVS
jgi:hypothetical protein